MSVRRAQLATLLAAGLAVAPLAACPKVPNPSFSVIDDGGSYRVAFTGEVLATSETEVVVEGAKGLELTFTVLGSQFLPDRPPVGEKVEVLFADDPGGRHLIVRIDSESGSWTPQERPVESSSGGDISTPCFLVTAALASVTGSPRGPEQRAMRAFRNRYMFRSPHRAALAERYYREAPAYVAAIDALPNRDAVWRHLWDAYLSEVFACARRADDAGTFRAYQAMMDDVVALLGPTGAATA